MSAAGTLYVIGVGPGDPGLLTLRAAEILKAVPVLCVPKGREEGSSLALSIVQGAIDVEGKEVIEAHFPMRKTREVEHAAELDAKWNGTVNAVLGRLGRGTDVAFITLGDPTVYSTFFYLRDRLRTVRPGLRIELVPGVSSINAAAASAGISLSLADEKVAIVPATYGDDLRDLLDKFDTVVLMKVHRVFDKVRQSVEDAGLLDRAVYVVRASMPDEKVFHDLGQVLEGDRDYFSMVIVRK